MPTDSFKEIKIRYQKVHNFFFKQLIYIIISFIAIFISIHIFLKQKELDKRDDFLIEKVSILGELNKKIQYKNNKENIKFLILNGSIENNEDLLVSYNNLILYNGFVLPKNSFIDHEDFTTNIEYFKNENYEVEELENLSKNLIFINTNNIIQQKQQIKLLPINENIEKTFYTQCFYQKKLFNYTCNYYIKNFLNSFFIYNIDIDYDGLLNIFNQLKNTRHKADFCEGIKKYSMYSNNTNNNLKQIFIECGDDFKVFFNDFSNFLETQEQLNKGYINTLIYTNENLNAYKLISFQQLIYNDLQQNIIDSVRFESYLNFLKEITKHQDKINKIYMDISFWFNKYYILDILNNNKYKVGENKKDQIENIIKNINTIDNGSQLEGIIGLKELISNKKIDESTKDDKDIKYIYSNEIETVLNNLKSLSFLKILNEKVFTSSIKINGYFLIDYNEQKLPIYLGFIVDKDGTINNINIGEYKELNDIIVEFSKQKNMSIVEVHQYIQNNIALFLSKNFASTCDIILNKFENYKKDNKQITRLELLDCQENLINIIKEEKNGETTERVRYKIDMDNFNINKIQISDKQLEDNITQYLKNIETNHITISNILQEIIVYKVESIGTKQEGSNDTIITIDDFMRYLSIKPKDIIEKNGNIIVEFNIKNISFIGSYDINNKTISDLYFKYNPQNDTDPENNIKEEDLLIKNLIIDLTKENEVNRFILNPLDYITDKDIEVITNYQNLKYK